MTLCCDLYEVLLKTIDGNSMCIKHACLGSIHKLRDGVGGANVTRRSFGAESDFNKTSRGEVGGSAKPKSPSRNL